MIKYSAGRVKENGVVGGNMTTSMESKRTEFKSWFQQELSNTIQAI